MLGSDGLLAEMSHGEAKSEAGSLETRLSSVMQPLIKSSCSARGKRPHCDGPGSLLASAIDAIPVLFLFDSFEPGSKVGLVQFLW